MLDAEILTAIAKNPIPGEAPCGESLRYDEAWAVLDAEIAKLENPAGGEVDWRAVEKGAGELLTRGKDLLLVAWLVRAMWHRDGATGLAAGLETIRDLLATFWDHLHPQRVRARRGALEWLGEKLAPVLDEQAIRGYPEETSRAIAAIDAIAAWSADKMDGEDCGLLGLASRLRELSAGGGDAAPAAGGEGEPAAEAAAGEAGAPAPAAAKPGAAAGPIANRAQAIAKLHEVGDWFAKHEPHSPIVPLLRRAEQWSRKDFQAVFTELLRNRQDALAQLWDVLGIVEEPPAQ